MISVTGSIATGQVGVIAVIEDGKITEWGSHHKLMEADGPYANLWRSWRDEN